MKNNKGFIIPLIIALVAILFIGSVVFVTTNKKVEAPEVVNTATTTPFISVGDKLGGMIVVSVVPFNTGQYTKDPSFMHLAPDNALIKLKGVITITGMYNYVKSEEGFTGYCMSGFDENSYLQLPILPTDDIKNFPPIFCFRNEDFAKKELGESTNEKKVTVQIDNFEIRRYPGTLADRADLFKVIFADKTMVTTTNQTDLPVMNKITPNSGPKGTMVEITGKNLSGFEGDLNVYFERPDGKTVMLTDTFSDYPKTGGDLIKVLVKEPCQPGEKVIGEYSGIESLCNYIELTPGIYKVYTEPWGVKSNVVNFTLTASSTSTCTPNWTCGWGACKNGYQGMTAVDSNNCGLSSSGVNIACIALARVCSGNQ